MSDDSLDDPRIPIDKDGRWPHEQKEKRVHSRTLREIEQLDRAMAQKVLHIELIRHALELSLPGLKRTIEQIEEAQKVSADLLKKRIGP